VISWKLRVVAVVDPNCLPSVPHGWVGSLPLGGRLGQPDIVMMVGLKNTRTSLFL